MNRYVMFLEKRTLKAQKYIIYIPNFLTLVNALCGFFAMIYACEGKLLTAAYYVVAAVICDGIDGRIARAFKCSSAFGGELDSLADALSFCGAPMVLLYQWIPGEFSHIELLFLGLYVCAGLWRLAKFNVTASQSQSFTGLPTTISALTVSLMIIYEPWIVKHASHVLNCSVLSFFVIALALLMVSSISFARLQQRFFYVHAVLMAFCLIMFAHAKGIPLLLFFVLFYIIFSVLSSLCKMLPLQYRLKKYF